MPTHQLQHLQSDDVVLDTLPDDVVATVEVRNAWFRNLAPAGGGFEFILSDLQSWTPGQTVRIAFLGGDTALHRDIANATQEISESCNLTLDFGVDPQTGAFRSWSEQDTEHAAEIRISFDKQGFFSLVGIDSVNPIIGSPLGDTGGRPHQCSLNLGGFTFNRPANWRGVVRHEILHALSFHHAHQNLRGPCEQEFRWEDDAGYVPTTDANGRFIADSAGRRPGIYTYLAGFPNFWSRSKVDHNLRTLDDDEVIIGPFDPESVMLYRFPDLFYHNVPSGCAPTGDGISLSEGDRRGLQLLYPDAAPEFEALVARRQALVETMEAAPQAVRGETGSTHAVQASVLRKCMSCRP